MPAGVDDVMMMMLGLGGLFGFGGDSPPEITGDMLAGAKGYDDFLSKDGGAGNFDGIFSTIFDAATDTGSNVLDFFGFGDGDGQFDIGDMIPDWSGGEGDGKFKFDDIFRFMSDKDGGLAGLTGGASSLMNMYWLGRQVFDREDWAKDMGGAEKAFMDMLFPGTNPFERLGSQGFASSTVSSMNSSLGNLGSSAISSRAPNRLAKLQEKMYDTVMKNMRKDIAQKMANIKKLSLESRQIEERFAFEQLKKNLWEFMQEKASILRRTEGQAFQELQKMLDFYFKIGGDKPGQPAEYYQKLWDQAHGSGRYDDPSLPINEVIGQ